MRMPPMAVAVPNCPVWRLAQAQAFRPQMAIVATATSATRPGRGGTRSVIAKVPSRREAGREAVAKDVAEPLVVAGVTLGRHGPLPSQSIRRGGLEIRPIIGNHRLREGL